MTATPDSLGGVTLPYGFVWADRDKYSRIVQQVDRTLAGNNVISYAPMVAGRPITLVGSDEFVWLTRKMVEDLQTLADADDVQELIYNQVGVDVNGLSVNKVVTTLVRFRHHDSPALDLVPINDNPNCDTWAGTIKLFTV